MTQENINLTTIKAFTSVLNQMLKECGIIPISINDRKLSLVQMISYELSPGDFNLLRISATPALEKYFVKTGENDYDFLGFADTNDTMLWNDN